MNKLALERLMFYSRTGIQLAILANLMIGAGSGPLILWMGIVVAVVIVGNLIQMKLIAPPVWSKVVWLLLEWVFFLTLFPFVAHSPYFILMIVLIASAVIAIDLLIPRVILVMLFGITPIMHHTYVKDFDWMQVLEFGLLIIFFIVFSYFFRRFEEQQDELEKLNVSLRGYVDKEKEWALEQERNKIARNLHDTVAHQSTGLIIQLQKLKMAYDLGRDHDVRESIKESEQVARTMLNEMRQSVRMIAPVATSDSPFEQLFSDFTQLTDMHIHHKGIVNLYSLSLSHQADLYAICQEALTNAKRHGHATEIDIQVKKAMNYLLITIEDNGIGVGDQWKKGFGLTKMSERVKEVDGEWDLSKDNGTKITIKWPLQKGETYD